MIFTACQLQQKCQEHNRDLHTMFVDLTKVFDTVSPEGLWQIMEKSGFPGKFISMVRPFHYGMLARVLDDGDSSNVFPVTNGVQQGCVLEPMLFSMMFSAILPDAFCDGEETSIKFKHGTDGRLFNLQRLQAKTKVEEDSVHYFLFEDGWAFNSAIEAQMQQGMNHFSTACRTFGLTFSTKRTEVFYQPTLQKT
ncbi:hypothetical protein NDU88_000725 [Pleurodeles waltl]|uniref:Reverse transcriptase domain-containing protein n=1 Tax=Pleurodeles waltl TaxID=8319 RepID=A0AAV7TFU9_PLEWA|nr:hypothetical protein NDU88_000725 [Pleurodeles waltl]